MTERTPTGRTSSGLPTESVTERERERRSEADRRAAMRMASDRGVKPGFLTSEFLTGIVVAISILIAAAIADDFGADDAWRLVAFLAIGYMLSRGLAKLGAGWRERRHESRG